MKSKSISTAFFLILFIQLFTTASFADWIPFNGGSETQFTSISVLKSDYQSTPMNISVPGMTVEQVDQDGETYQQIRISKGRNRNYEPGYPNLPVIPIMIAIPHNVSYSISVTPSSQLSYNNYNLYPVQPIVSSNDPPPPFTKDNAFYDTNIDYPSILYRDSGVGDLRGIKILNLEITPFRYNPLNKSLIVFNNFNINITFTPIPGQIPVKADGQNVSFFDNFLSSTIVNYRQYYRDDAINLYLLSDSAQAQGRSAAKEAIPAEAKNAEYLIIAHRDFAGSTALQNFANWKRQKGYSVYVVYTDEIDPTYDDTLFSGQDWKNPKITDMGRKIKEYLRTIYSFNKLKYLLIIGDAEFIPPYYGRTHMYIYHRYIGDDGVGYAGRIGSDTYYGIMETDEYDGIYSPLVPDILIGRLPAQTNSELSIMINKIIKYDKGSFSSVDWLNNIILAGQNEPMDSHIYIQNEFYNYMIANYSDIYDIDVIWNTSPSDSNQQALNAVNAGAFLVNYAGHGFIDFWMNPYITINDVSNLNNGEKLPVVFQSACDTNWFDRETDYTDASDYPESIGEQWLRKSNGGAIASIGATRVSFGTSNLFKFFVDAIWQDYEPDWPVNPISTYKLGENLFAALLSNWFEGTSAEDMQETILLGDPEMDIRTEAPKTLTVVHPTNVPNNNVNFTVNVTSSSLPIHGAHVALYSESNNFVETRFTDTNGDAIFQFTSVSPGSHKITVTGVNLKYYQGNIQFQLADAKVSIKTITPQLDGHTGDNLYSQEPVFEIIVWNEAMTTPIIPEQTVTGIAQPIELGEVQFYTPYVVEYKTDYYISGFQSIFPTKYTYFSLSDKCSFDTEFGTWDLACLRGANSHYEDDIYDDDRKISLRKDAILYKDKPATFYKYDQDYYNWERGGRINDSVFDPDTDIVVRANTDINQDGTLMTPKIDYLDYFLFNQGFACTPESCGPKAVYCIPETGKVREKRITLGSGSGLCKRRIDNNKEISWKDADFTHDNIVDVDDIAILKKEFGGMTSIDADIDGSGYVDIEDLGLYKKAFGCEPSLCGLPDLCLLVWEYQRANPNLVCDSTDTNLDTNPCYQHCEKDSEGDILTWRDTDINEDGNITWADYSIIMNQLTNNDWTERHGYADIDENGTVAEKDEELFLQVDNCTSDCDPDYCILTPRWYNTHPTERCNPPSSGTLPPCAQHCEISRNTDNYLRYFDADFDGNGIVDGSDYDYFFGAAGPTFMTGLGKTVRPGDDYKRVNWHKDDFIDLEDWNVFNRGRSFCEGMDDDLCLVCDDDPNTPDAPPCEP